MAAALDRARHPAGDCDAPIAVKGLLIRCGCGYLVDYPVRLLIEYYGSEADLHLISARLRCLNCKGRPVSVELVDRPDRRGEGHGGGAPATIKPLP